jgi:UDP-N-acetylglucosamine 2-epimerase (non-hydrolysing)
MISIVLGTRPEIIKMAPVIRACMKYNITYSIIHTGQHYSYEMDRVFFEELSLPLPKYNLDVGSGSHAEQTAAIMKGIERVLIRDSPDVVLVQGDTNTVLAGGLVGAKLHIPVGHVEAGLRSYDRTMPEEINRVVVDHVSDYLFAPTEDSHQKLVQEGIDESKIYITGNTVVDSLFQNQKIASEKSSIMQEFDLISGNYLLVTAHRAENVDDKSRLEGIIAGIRRVSDAYSLPVIFPMHPRTLKMVKEFGISTEGIKIISPVGYLDFLELEINARLILTDSGGVQEEACILQVPCVTLRENTERPETVDVGGNLLAGSDPVKIATVAERMISSSRMWVNPYGDGTAGEKIVEICEFGEFQIK